MAKGISQVYGFAYGRLDADLSARSDLKAYYQGAREALNVVPRALTGMDRRPGLTFQAFVPEAAGGFRWAAFEAGANGRYMVLFLPGVLRIRKDGLTAVADILTPWSAGHLPTLYWTQSADTMFIFAEGVPPYRLQRQGADYLWSLVPCAWTNPPTWKFSGQSEPAWSAGRGWPAVGTLREGRLHVGNTAALPNHLWCTTAGEYFDWSVTDDAKDDESADLAFDDDEANVVYGLISADRLIAITSGGPWAVPDSPTTPANYYGRRVARLKCARIRPNELDGSVVFVSSGEDGAHMSVFELVYDEGSESRFVCSDLALYSSDTLRNPIELATRRGTAASTANYLYVVNADGTCAVLHSRRSEKVTAWTLWRTDGDFIGALTLGNAAFFMVRRTLGGQVRYCLERLDEDALADCSRRASAATAQTQWSGFDHLEAHSVRVVADGAVAGTFTVQGGAITLPVPAREIEAGLSFPWTVETMPPEAQLADGTLIGAKSRIWKTVVQVAATGSLTINGRLIEHRRLDAARLDAAPPLYSGEISLRLLGWGARKPIRISGDDLVPASVLAVTIFLSANE